MEVVHIPSIHTQPNITPKQTFIKQNEHKAPFIKYCCNRRIETHPKVHPSLLWPLVGMRSMSVNDVTHPAHSHHLTSHIWGKLVPQVQKCVTVKRLGRLQGLRLQVQHLTEIKKFKH